MFCSHESLTLPGQKSKYLRASNELSLRVYLTITFRYSEGSSFRIEHMARYS